MTQIENEFGNYGYSDYPRDKNHLKFIKKVLRDGGRDRVFCHFLPFSVFLAFSVLLCLSAFAYLSAIYLSIYLSIYLPIYLARY